jgi:hypothetical protein
MPDPRLSEGVAEGDVLAQGVEYQSPLLVDEEDAKYLFASESLRGSSLTRENMI